MKKSRVWKWIAACGTTAVLALSFAFSIGVGEMKNPLDESEGKTESNIPVAKAATVTYPTGSNGLGQFPDGFSYTYTNKDYIEGYHKKSRDTDLEIVTVTHTMAHGTQANPYVISTTADWQQFASLMSTDTTHGNGKFYVLANDIDFSSVTKFYPIPFFNGSFYGMGHELKNIISKDWTYVNGTQISTAVKAYGLFCRMDNATITDLIVKDFSYQQMPNAALGVDGRNDPMGGVVGWMLGNSAVLNCHTSGAFSSTVSYTLYGIVGGIVGQEYTTAAAKAYVYRCSSEFSCQLTFSPNAPLTGGIMGENFHSKATLYMWDCVAHYTHTITSGYSGFWSSVAIGFGGGPSITYIDNAKRLHSKLPKKPFNSSALLQKMIYSMMTVINITPKISTGINLA